MTAETTAWRMHTFARQLRTRWVDFRTLVFGDRVGYTLFLGSLVFLVCSWRVGVFINDSHTLLNTLVAIENGNLHIEAAQYGRFDSPGTHLVDSRVYGRNYGQVFLALPFLVALRGLTAVVYPSVAIVAGWSLLLLAFSRSLGDVLDRPRAGVVVGSLLALAAFAAGLVTAYPLAPDRLPVLALQFGTVLATAFGAVLAYRLVSRRGSHRAGVAAGFAYAAVLPTAFWATIPKRHALTTTLVFVSLYLLHRARETDGSTSLFYRAGAYVPVGLTAWVHAPEGFLLLIGVGLADITTARSNTPRELASVAGVLFLSLLPFFVTNVLVTGSPLLPPRLTPGFDATVANGMSTAATSPSNTASVASRELLPTGLGLPDRPAVLDRFSHGLVIVLSEPRRVVDTFLMSEGFDSADRNMSVLESAPLLAVLVGSVFGLHRTSPRTKLSRLQSDPARAAVTIAAVVYVSLLVFLFIPSLPLHAQINVRYLLPVYPLVLLALVEMSAVHAVLEEAWRTLLWSYTAGVFVGTQLLVAAFVLLGTTLEGSMRLESHLALGIAILLVVWTIAYSLDADSNRSLRVGAVLLGLAAAAGTAFVLISAWWYFPYGPFALPFVPQP